MLEVDNIETFYGRKQVLFGVALKIAAGEVVTLIGRNGMGKTTTVHSIIGFTPARRGAVRFEGCDVTALPSYKIARLGVGLVPEGRQIFHTLTVHENLVATAAKQSPGRGAWTAARVYDLFPQLYERRSNMGWQLSGGEQQMLAIGRALLTNPKILILDEATEGIAPVVRKEIWRCLELLKRAGQALLVIDKDIEALLELANRHYVIVKGRIVWSGTTLELRDEPSIIHRYLGV
jgi:branched-chain amino acid transport system ATP-binding protein